MTGDNQDHLHVDSADLEPDGDEKEWTPGEPQAVAGVPIQDNVSEPGVQHTRYPDGSHTAHGAGVEDDDTPDDSVQAADPGAEPVSDEISVTVALVAGEGWADVPVDPSDVLGATLPEGTTGEVHFAPSTDQAGATCVTVDGITDADATGVVVTLTVEPPAAPPAS